MNDMVNLRTARRKGSLAEYVESIDRLHAQEERYRLMVKQMRTIRNELTRYRGKSPWAGVPWPATCEERWIGFEALCGHAAGGS